MLDNFDGEGLKVAAQSIKQRWAGKREFLLECSGGLTAENVGTYINNGKSKSDVYPSLLTGRQTSISSRRVRYTKAYRM